MRLVRLHLGDKAWPINLDQFRLDGQTALVIGGNRGLGLEMAKALAEAGASIFIAGRDAARNEQRAGDHRQRLRPRVWHRRCDVTDPGQVAATVAAAVAQFGKIDVLINSAGINIRGRDRRRFAGRLRARCSG